MLTVEANVEYAEMVSEIREASFIICSFYLGPKISALESLKKEVV